MKPGGPAGLRWPARRSIGGGMPHEALVEMAHAAWLLLRGHPTDRSYTGAAVFAERVAKECRELAKLEESQAE